MLSSSGKKRIESNKAICTTVMSVDITSVDNVSAIGSDKATHICTCGTDVVIGIGETGV